MFRRHLEKRLELCCLFQDRIIPIVATGVQYSFIFFIFFTVFLIFLQIYSLSFYQFSPWPSALLAFLSTMLISNTQTSVE